LLPNRATRLSENISLFPKESEPSSLNVAETLKARHAANATLLYLRSDTATFANL